MHTHYSHWRAHTHIHIYTIMDTARDTDKDRMRGIDNESERDGDKVSKREREVRDYAIRLLMLTFKQLYYIIFLSMC